MRIAIISDIHEDILNLKKVLAKVEKTGYDKLVCLGDISGFSVPHYKYMKTRNAHECLSLLREKCDIIVPGNHDYHAARIIPKTSSVFDFPGNWYELDYRKKFNLANDTIWLHEENDLDPLYRKEDIAFLRSLPEYQVVETPSAHILFSHYVYPNLAGFKKGFYSTPSEFTQHFEFMKKKGCLVSFTGHAHIKGFYMVSRSYFGQYRRKKIISRNFPICIGIPPVTSNKNRSGFCIFDGEKFIVQAVRC